MLLAIAPVFFAKGLTATYLHPMVLAFALAVIASMVVAFTFTPGGRDAAVRPRRARDGRGRPSAPTGANFAGQL